MTAKSEQALRNEQLVLGYTSGRTLRYLAKEYQLSVAQIRRILLKSDITLRSQGTPGNHA